MDERESYDAFTPDFQKMILAMLLYDKDSVFLATEIIRPDVFSNPVISDMARLLLDFYNKYSRVPTETEYIEEIASFLKTTDPKYLAAPEDEYLDMLVEVGEIGKKALEIDASQFFRPVRDKAVDFVRVQEAEKIIRTTAKNRDYGSMVVGLQRALSIGTNIADLGNFLKREFENRLLERRETRNRAMLGIPTGFPSIDRRLGAGGKPGGICPLVGRTYCGSLFF